MNGTHGYRTAPALAGSHADAREKAMNGVREKEIERMIDWYMVTPIPIGHKTRLRTERERTAECSARLRTAGTAVRP